MTLFYGGASSHICCCPTGGSNSRSGSSTSRVALSSVLPGISFDSENETGPGSGSSEFKPKAEPVVPGSSTGSEDGFDEGSDSSYGPNNASDPGSGSSSGPSPEFGSGSSSDPSIGSGSDNYESGSDSGPGSGAYTTSAIYSSIVYTVTSCRSAVTKCPARLTTSTYIVGTTVCPVSKTADAGSASPIPTPQSDGGESPDLAAPGASSQTQIDWDVVSPYQQR
ncbi:hypothetical protein GE09DRAFT_1062891 [Coniochaeta sp. 2T2.1]|nr:hypothetical protein GE09DRAFT_1062891 [Coniochaeta sp. 2T2.1]